MPPCCQKRWSSIATVAFFIQGLTLEYLTGWRLRSAGIEPSSEPSAAYTNEFWPIRTGRNESRLHVCLKIWTLPKPTAATTQARTIGIETISGMARVLREARLRGPLRRRSEEAGLMPASRLRAAPGGCAGEGRSRGAALRARRRPGRGPRQSPCRPARSLPRRDHARPAPVPVARRQPRRDLG